MHCRIPDPPLWVVIEGRLKEDPLGLKALYLPDPVTADTPNLMLKAMYAAWMQAHKFLLVDVQLHDKAPIWNNTGIHMGGMLDWGPWHRAGMQNLTHLISGGELKSFEMLQDKFGLLHTQQW
ncbi:hypothetical protein NDU88_003927 [Pleurodeles waltl]|uniref:Uncharacterized protein n=1 Tax=Pleurodeles waltl TaxID=8319 RepID=A0AAV7WWP0_PLEWA|nr:hypothetical protein NDU88_003927 [Pleurodeles waltl]